MKKTVIFMLLFAVILSCVGLVGCGKKNQETPTTEPVETESLTTSKAENNQLDVPKDLNYDTSFIVMTYNTDIPEFCDIATERPDAVESALMERDAYILDYLGLDMVYDTSTPGNYPERDQFCEKVRTAVNQGMRAFDMIAGYSLVPPNLALEGLLVDMNQLDYIDFNKAWYPQFMLDVCTINDKTYFMVGDGSSMSLYRMVGVLFSESLASANGISENDLYQMVYDGEWTYENWFELCDGLAKELDGDGVWDAGDFYPIQTAHSYAIDCFYPSAGFTLMDKDENGLVKVSDDPVSEKMIDFYELVYDAEHTSHIYRDGYDETLIVNKKCIFQISALGSFRLYFEEADEGFRVLPSPKLEAGSNDTNPYRTFVASHIQYCIPKDVKDPNRSGAVMELMNYAGYIYLVPAIFEKTMKSRYSPTNDVANMYDIMRNGRDYEIGSAFYMTFHAYGYENDASTMFRYNVQKNTTNWISVYKQNYEPGLHYVCRLINEFYTGEAG